MWRGVYNPGSLMSAVAISRSEDGVTISFGDVTRHVDYTVTGMIDLAVQDKFFDIFLNKFISLKDEGATFFEGTYVDVEVLDGSLREFEVGDYFDLQGHVASRLYSIEVEAPGSAGALRCELGATLE